MLAARADVRLDDVDAFARHLVVSERGGGLERLRVLRLADDGTVADDHLVAMPDAVYSVWTGSNLEYDTDLLRYQYTSLVAPASAFDFDVTAQHLHPGEAPAGARLRPHALREPSPVGHRPRRHAGADLAWCGGPTPRTDGEAGPLLLYGYGSYEVSIDPTFSVGRVSLLDRGVAFAIAHIRGGGEMGRAWYDDGKLLHKRNTFTDFVACADHLVAEGWTTPEQLAIRGGSAGGLLMGAVTNLRPRAVPRGGGRGAVRRLPHHHPRRVAAAHRDRVGGVGRPGRTTPRSYDYMKSYSPYDNVVAGGLPRHARHRRAQRPPRAVLGAGQVGGEAAHRRAPTTASSC